MPHGNFRHGEAIPGHPTPEYTAYINARDRCTNPRHRDFKNYGGRGIKFRFKSVHQFLAEVGRKPSPEFVLDRIDNDGHYEVGNLRWATRSESQKNQRPMSDKTRQARIRRKYLHYKTGPRKGQFKRVSSKS